VERVACDINDDKPRDKNVFTSYQRPELTGVLDLTSETVQQHSEKIDYNWNNTWHAVIIPQKNNFKQEPTEWYKTAHQ
jgi:hypothetical protein